MQYNSRQTGRPPAAVEPTGFFEGVQIRPVIFGVVIDYIATFAGIYAYFFVYVAKELSKKGEVSPEVITTFMLSDEGLMIGFVIGMLGTMIGGFVAARKAGVLEIKHGAFVAVGSLVVSAIEQAMQEESVPLPEWFRFLSVAATIPAGALGGYLAEKFKGLVGFPPSRRGGLPGR